MLSTKNMTLCHFTLDEIEGFDDIQKELIIDPKTGIRMYPVLGKVIKMPGVKEIFYNFFDDFKKNGKLSKENELLYKRAKQSDIVETKKTNLEKKGKVKKVADYGRFGDTYIAWMPNNFVKFLVELRGGYSKNPQTGLLEFGWNPFKSIGKGIGKIFRAGATVVGFALGGPLGAGLANVGANLLSGRGVKQSLVKGLKAGALGYGAQGIGSAMGLGNSMAGMGGIAGKLGSQFTPNLITQGLGSLGIGSLANAGTTAGLGAGLSAGTTAGTTAGLASTAQTVANPGMLSKIGSGVSNFLGSPLGTASLIAGSAYLGHKADKQVAKQLNEAQRMKNEQIEDFRKRSGYYDKYTPKPFTLTRNENYTVGSETEPYYKKKGGSIELSRIKKELSNGSCFKRGK